METVSFSKMLASTDESTWCQNPEEEHHHPHYHENLKSHIAVALFIVTENACHEDFGQKPSTEGRECYM
jgi:hypothetical protein